MKEENLNQMETIASQLDAKVEKLIDHRMKEISTTVANTVAAQLVKTMKGLFSTNRSSQKSPKSTGDRHASEQDSLSAKHTSATIFQLEEKQVQRNPRTNGSQDMLLELNRIERQNKQNKKPQDPTHDKTLPGSLMKT